LNINNITEEIRLFLNKYNFEINKDLLRGTLFLEKKSNSAIIIDQDICNNEKAFSYTQYTKEQNLLMHKHNSLYRFIVDDEKDFNNFKSEIIRLFDNDLDEENIKNSGANRNLKEIDPSIPEAYFEQAFIEIYGNESLESVLREEPFIDINSRIRYIDYLIITNYGNIAIEKNGELYHHPIIIGKDRYKSQLLKQNSIVQNNMKIYRWSIEGMKAKESFHEELKIFIGKKEDLKIAQKLSVSRKIKLFSHQEITLDSIDKEREEGEKNFLVVLPTGTGKTEIYIHDMINQIKKGVNKVLVLVPQKPLRDDTIKKIKTRITNENIEMNVGNELNKDIVVVTYSYISRHYYEIDKEYFEYIVVDEAHHSVAPTLRKVIQHFNPKTLIGLTATDKRLDEKKLEDIFGKYEENLSLKEAIEKGILAPIKAFRIESNIDLSEVRFNGKDYVGTDLQRTLIVPSRDQLIVDVLKKYFHPSVNDFKSGIIFCVSIKHAESLSKLMKNQGFSCEAVSSENDKSSIYIEEYQKGKIQFLTTCSLLNEGWDSPRTSIIVMARPTLSKVLYTQQLGRGTRKMEGKEALYVLDIVDNYGAYGKVSNRPWSIHALLGISSYKEFADILEPEKKPSREELLLDSLFEEERKLRPIDIFTFEENYGDYYSDEKLARELFVSTGTIKSWVKKGKIFPSVTLNIGKIILNYYSPEYKEEIIKNLNLKKHDETTIYEDFFEFLNERDYSLSYKIIMLLSIIKIMDVNGECNLDKLIDEYSFFYKERLRLGLLVDRKTCPFTDEYLNESKKMKQNLLINPFEKFERKRFMHYAKDLNYIMFASSLWEKLSKEDIEKTKNQIFKDLIDYYDKLEAPVNIEKWKEYWNING